jgi:predicted CXXCH cytochrome family protein
MRLGTIANKLLPAVLLLSLVTVTGCSVKKNQKLLNFFFDGVPTPEEIDARKNQDETAKPGDRARKKNRAAPGKTWVKIKSRHPDFFKNVCNNCHNRSSSNFLKTEKKEICFSCHKQDRFEGRFVHGPVAVKQCLSCHFPHESQYEKLLRAKDADLCRMCHKKEHVSPPESCDRSKKCTTCHDPHVGDNRFFVKNKNG